MSSAVPAESRSTDGMPESAASPRFAALEGRLAAALIVIAALLYFIPINGYERDYDEGVYWQSLRAMAAGHPLFTSVFSSQPPLFLLSIYPFYMIFGQSIAAARVGIAIFALVGLIAMFWLASMVGGRWGGLIATALLVVDPFYLHQAQTLQAEGPAVAIEILSVALGAAASRRQGRWRMILATLAGVAIAYGTLIKLLNVVALVPIVLYLGAPLLRAFYTGEGRIGWPTETGLRVGLRAAGRDLGLMTAGIVGMFIVGLAPFATNLGPLWDQVVAFHLAAAHTQAWSALHNLNLMSIAFKWAIIPAALVVAAALWLRDWRVAPPALWLIASVAILDRQNPLFDHHMVIIGPCLALLAGLAPAFLRALRPRLSGVWPVIVPAAYTLVLAFVLAHSFSDSRAVLNLAASKPTAAVQTEMAAINSFTSPGAIVVTDDQYAAAQAGHSVPPELVDTSLVRLSSGYLTATQLENIIQRDHVNTVILSTDRLTQNADFIAWLHANFTLEANLGQGMAIYIRAPSGAVVA